MMPPNCPESEEEKRTANHIDEEAKSAHYRKEWQALNVMRVMGGDEQLYAFTVSGGVGFQLTFLNGLKLSVQFGPENYCENRGAKGSPAAHITRAKYFSCTSDTAEVAIIDEYQTHQTAFVTQAIWDCALYRSSMRTYSMSLKPPVDGVGPHGETSTHTEGDVRGHVHLDEIMLVMNQLWTMTREEVDSCIQKSDPKK